MKKIRGTLVAAVLLAGVALSGCESSGAAKDEPPAKVADPKAAIAAAVAAMKEGNYAFTAKTPDSDTKGTVHLPSKSVSMQMGTKSAQTKGTIELRLVEPDRWMKITMDLGNLGGGLGTIDTSDPEAAKFAESMRQMTEMFNSPDRAAARRAMEAMLKMVKIDVAEIERAYAGEAMPVA